MSNFCLSSDVLFYSKYDMQKGLLMSNLSNMEAAESNIEFWDCNSNGELRILNKEEELLKFGKKNDCKRLINLNNSSKNFSDISTNPNHDNSSHLTPNRLRTNQNDHTNSHLNDSTMSPSSSPNDDETHYKPRRVSSLKSNRTPPGTPKSKAVRFADAFGLDLEDVRHIFNIDQPPKIPASAVQDLVLESNTDSISQEAIIVRYLPNFSQPGAAADFLRHLRTTNVSLENSFIENNILSGTVRVMNLAFDKKITARVSFDDWRNIIDVNAGYVRESHDGVTDRFSFSLLMPSHCQNLGCRIQFAIRYECSTGGVFWDNNGGRNYIFTCYGPGANQMPGFEISPC